MRLPIPGLFQSISLSFLAVAVFGPKASGDSDRATFSVHPEKVSVRTQREGDKISVNLRSQALVRGIEFTVGDVAEITPKDTELAGRVARIVITRSPWPGYDQRVTPDSVRMVLPGKVKDLSQVEVGGARECIVKVASVRISAETFLKVAEQHLLRQLPWPDDQVELKCTRAPQDRYVPIGTGSGPVLEIVDVDSLKRRGIARVRARVIVDGQVAYQNVLVFNIETFQDVVVASGHIRQGTTLSSDNITIERRKISDFSFGFFSEPRKVIGKRATKNIRPGAILTLNQIKEPPVIAPKSIVDIVYNIPSGNKSIRISFQGIAEEEGARGDIIRIRNLSTHKQHWCQVIDGRTARMTNAR